VDVNPGLRGALPLVILSALARPAGAQIPSRCPEPEARQFDFWIGEWDVENRQRSPDASPGDKTLFATGTATDRVSEVLGGCAIVEHWFGELTHTTQRGYSVRAWNPALEAWVLWLNWPGPRGAGFARLEGTFEDGSGTFSREVEGAQGPATVRFTFSDITDDSLVWTGAFAPRGGSWTRFWVMDFARRRDADSLGPYNGMAEGTDGCPSEKARAFDFLVGEWESEDGAALSARSILDGCAVSQEERWAERGGSATTRYRLRALDAATGSWAMISIDDRGRTFSRWDARVEEALPALLRDAGGGIHRLRYEDVEGDRFRRLEERSTDDGETWTAVDDRVFVRVLPRP
jgi:hypothetical protein